MRKDGTFLLSGKFSRYLIWEDGYCGRMHGGISGFEVMDLLIKEKGLLRGSRCEERSAEVGRPTEDRIFALVHKRMASQVHIVGDGYADFFFLIFFFLKF